MEWINKLWHIHNMTEYDSVYWSGILYIYNQNSIHQWECTNYNYMAYNPNTIWKEKAKHKRCNELCENSLSSIIMICLLFWLEEDCFTMLGSAVQQCKSVITIYVYHLPLEPPSTPYLTPLGRNRGPGWSPCVIQKLLTRYLFYAWYYIYMFVGEDSLEPLGLQGDPTSPS